MKTTRFKKAALLLSLLPLFAFASQWSYEGSESPDHWSELDPAFRLCQQGKNQSPVDIHGVMQANLSLLRMDYPDLPDRILNNGHTIQVTFPDNSNNAIILDNERYVLKQLHFHAPAENTINGRQYPMEMHLVHANADGELAVVAVMFETGAANKALAKFWQAMPEKAEQNQPLQHIDPISTLLPADRHYYRYSGSLTTPPCSEGVSWLVLKQPMTLSAAQLAKFTSVMHHHNNRPVQPLHGRILVE